jgi:pilus assembly protein CpaF
MLQAMNTGHRGSLTTAHANGPYHALLRLETMALMAGLDLPLAAVREQIRRGIDVVVHQERDPDGRRRIVHIAEVDAAREGYALRDVPA